MSMGRGRRRNRCRLAVPADDAGADRHAGSRPVGGIGLEITRPLEAELIGSNWIEDAVPAGDDETLVIIRVTVVLDPAIALNSCGVIAVGLMEVLPEEASAEVVIVVELKVQLGEEDVLLDVATVSSGGLRDEEIGCCGALCRSERSWAGRSRVRVA